jgi:carbamoyltransferase
MLILGIDAFAHDSAASLVSDGDVIGAVEEERLSRVKHTGAFPALAIEACLREASATFGDVDAVAFYWDPWLTIRRRFWNTLRPLPVSLGELLGSVRGAGDGRVRGGIRSLARMLRLQRRFETAFGPAGRDVCIEYVPHHLAHAASAFYTSPFESAAIWTVDGTGEHLTSLFAAGTPAGIETIQGTPYPHSLGALYGALTQYLGYRAAADEWRVMALAAYGRPHFYDSLRRLVELREDGTLRLDLRYFRFQLPCAPVWYSSRLAELLGPPRGPGQPATDERFVDIAASLQKLAEEVALHMVRCLYSCAPQENLVIAGGVALNAAMSHALCERSPFRRIFIPPAPHDAGCAPGAALHLHRRWGGRRGAPMRHAYLGPGYNSHEIERALSRSGLPFARMSDVCGSVAQLLTEQKVIGWFQGRMEFGPRALGNRSILADPRTPSMRDQVNEKVKFRESFRPFAPSIPAERFAEYFEGVPRSPFMVFLRRAKASARDRIPAVIHVDGTARVQTVERDLNPRFHRLLSCFEERSGVPVLLNTSFNVADEPIVCSPDDAIRCFLRSGLDCLAIGDFLVSKSSVHPETT